MFRKLLLLLFLGACLMLQAKKPFIVCSYIRGGFYNSGQISDESLLSCNDLIYISVHPNADGTLRLEKPSTKPGEKQQEWESVVKSVQAKLKNRKDINFRLGIASGEWLKMSVDPTARTTFAKNIKELVDRYKVDGVDIDFEGGREQVEYDNLSLILVELREVLGTKSILSTSLHPVGYQISKAAIDAVDFITFQCYGPRPIHFPMDQYIIDVKMALDYGFPKEKLVPGVPFYGVTKDGSRKTMFYHRFVKDGLITSPKLNEVNYKGDIFLFDGQDNIRKKTRYAMDMGLRGIMSWDLATDLPFNDSKSLLKAMVEEVNTKK